MLRALLLNAESTNYITQRGVAKFEIEYSVSTEAISFFEKISQITIDPGQYHKGNTKDVSKAPLTTDKSRRSSLACEVSILLVPVDENYQSLPLAATLNCPNKCPSRKNQKSCGIHSIFFNKEEKKINLEIATYCIPIHLNPKAEYGKYQVTFQKNNATIVACSGNYISLKNRLFNLFNIDDLTIAANAALERYPNEHPKKRKRIPLQETPPKKKNKSSGSNLNSADSTILIQPTSFVNPPTPPVFPIPYLQENIGDSNSIESSCFSPFIEFLNSTLTSPSDNEEINISPEETPNRDFRVALEQHEDRNSFNSFLTQNQLVPFHEPF